MIVEGVRLIPMSAGAASWPRDPCLLPSPPGGSECSFRRWSRRIRRMLAVLSPASPPVITAPLTPVPPGATFDPYAVPSSQPPYSLAQTPPAAAPAPYSPYTPSPYAPPPGSATPPPYSPTPGALYPDVGPAQAQPIYQPVTPLPVLGQPLRLLQGVWLRETYLFGNGGSNALEVNDIETSATFAVPMFFCQPPLLITPGFGVHFFGGPSTTPTQPGDLPPETYDAYIDVAWDRA